ncbi:MAG: histidine phosphatase family protein [Candidatus Binatia bacterium]
MPKKFPFQADQKGADTRRAKFDERRRTLVVRRSESGERNEVDGPFSAACQLVMEVVLLRHGATDWNLQGRCQGATDLALNETGVRQAESIAARLSREKIAAVYSSNLKRAQQTAEFVGRPHSLSINIEEDIRELDHGVLEGLTFNDIKENFPEFIQRWRTEPAEIQVPGGEKLADVAHRAWNGLHRIVQQHQSGETIVVVSHNFPILGVLCRITGIHLNRYRTFHLDPCGVTRLNRSSNGDWSITQINNKNYIPD